MKSNLNKKIFLKFQRFQRNNSFIPGLETVSLKKVIIIPLTFIVASGFVSAYLESRRWTDNEAEIVNVERDDENKKQNITYRYHYKHYLFEKTITEQISFLGAKELTNYKVGDRLKIMNSLQNPKLSCQKLPIFQPIGFNLFQDYLGIEIHQINPHIQLKIEERQKEKELKEEKGKWKDRINVIQNKKQKEYGD